MQLIDIVSSYSERSEERDLFRYCATLTHDLFVSVSNTVPDLLRIMRHVYPYFIAPYRAGECASALDAAGVSHSLTARSARNKQRRDQKVTPLSTAPLHGRAFGTEKASHESILHHPTDRSAKRRALSRTTNAYGWQLIT